MGFLSKLVNKVTGGWAEVSMEVPPTVQRGTAFEVTAEVDVKGEPIDVENVAIELQCIDMVDAVDPDKTDTYIPPQTARTLHHYEVEVATAQQLAAGSHHDYSATFTIDPSNHASDRERTWMARAVVRMPGNDPDSNWKVFDVT